MTSREIVIRAIEFRAPPRLPFWQEVLPDVPNDVCGIWEMDRAQAGWFFGQAGLDDWGCRWRIAQGPNMGQVVEHPLADWSVLDRYVPPNPRNPFYFERLGPLLDQAADRYVVVTCHFNLIERLHMLRGFIATMEDFHQQPCEIELTLDMVLDFKLALLEELARRFGPRIHGVFLTDDWGTQRSTFVARETFEQFFAARYRRLFDAIHGHGWHVFLHSCGRINDFVPRLIELGVDVLNMQQPRAYGLVEFGERHRGKVCFLTTVDIQATLPRGIEQDVRDEVRQLVRHWSTPEGGFIVFNYGDDAALAVPPGITRLMFGEFARLQCFWQHIAPNIPAS